MRKLTGYIGALIIVFALMGSILAGYALNVNGSSSVINEYEKVTDVSGLYSHSQEPNYIDYNPASNYINYSMTDIKTTVNPGATYYKKCIDQTITVRFSDKAVLINGVVNWSISPGDYAFICDKFYIFMEAPQNGGLRVYADLGGGVWFESAYTDIIITNYDDGNLSLSFDNKVLQYNDLKLRLVVCNDGTADYIAYNDVSGTFDVALNNEYQTICAFMDNGIFGVAVGNDGYRCDGVTISDTFVRRDSDLGIDAGIYTLGLRANEFYYFYPQIVNYSEIKLGINYTESNRVNNYPIETDYVDTGQVITSRLNLMSVSATDYWTSGAVYVYENTHYYGPGESYRSIRYMPETIEGHSYRLSDITDIEIIATTANYIRIDAPLTLTDYSFTDNNIFFDDNPYTINFRAPTGNWAVLVPFANVGQQTVLDFNSLANQYVYYYPDTGKCELYNSAGVKQGTYDNLDQLYVIFVDTETLFNNVEIYEIDNLYQGTYRYGDWNPVKTAPFINLTYETGGTVSTIHYADITKGFSIKNDNVNNVIWDNEYSNGNIQLLFRADNVLGTYHNDIIVGDNTISVDYNSNRYLVTLNGAAPIDIGTWRNMIIDLDFRNGTLSAIPVRTFNSYTNVEMDTASIFIGDLTNPAPTNTIEWAPTPNSLMFNVYSTAVFMNTYGVVMVNPSLNITDYFTDLNNFYRLKLYNFGVLGDTVTVNGITGNVSNNVLSINGQSIQIKEMSITYADGHAYISDSNADIDLGEISDNNISMTGAWYFETDLSKGYTSQKMVYEWDWGDFILNNTQFCIMYMGIALIGLIVARRYCTMSITDYIVLVVSFAIALTVQVIA